MTAALELFARLRRRGVAIERAGAILVIRPAEFVTPAEIAALKRHKPELLRLLGPAALGPDPIAAFKATLGALWTLGAEGPDADRAEITRLLDAQARQCDDLGPEFAAAVSRQASREWSTREKRCAFCGLENVYHDPDSGEEITLEKEAT